MAEKPELVEGEWNFKGYYPFGCKQRPSCYTRKMTFKQADTSEQGDYHRFETTAHKEGQACDVNERDTEFHGYTWFNQNKIQYGGNGDSTSPNLFFNQLASKYHYEGKDGEYARLFIKDKGVDKRCFTIFEKDLDTTKTTYEKAYEEQYYNVTEIDKFSRFMERDAMDKQKHQARIQLVATQEQEKMMIDLNRALEGFKNVPNFSTERMPPLLTLDFSKSK